MGEPVPKEMFFKIYKITSPPNEERSNHIKSNIFKLLWDFGKQKGKKYVFSVRESKSIGRLERV